MLSATCLSNNRKRPLKKAEIFNELVLFADSLLNILKTKPHTHPYSIYSFLANFQNFLLVTDSIAGMMSPFQQNTRWTPI